MNGWKVVTKEQDDRMGGVISHSFHGDSRDMRWRWRWKKSLEMKVSELLKCLEGLKVLINQPDILNHNVKIFG